MGRWKRKVQHHKKNSSKNHVEELRQVTSDETNSEAGEEAPPKVVAEEMPARTAVVIDKHRMFNTFEQERIYAYLVEYKRLAEQHYRPSPTSDVDSTPIQLSASYCSADYSGSDTGDNDDVTVKTTNKTFTGKMKVVSFSIGGVDDDMNPAADDSVVGLDVMGHVFPQLTIDNVSSKPYLMLPMTLSNKQRRCVHELCIEAGLFHESIGDHPYKRHVVVSPFESGFDTFVISGRLNPPTSIPIRKCKPWFYRSHDQTFRSYVMQMSSFDIELDQNGYVEGTAEASACASSTVKQIASWHFSRKRSMSTFGIDVNKIFQGGENEVLLDENIEDEILTPKLKNTSFFRAKRFASDKLETTRNGAADVNSLVESIMKTAEQIIWELIDQPSKCIRDDYDAFDFRALLNEDLSTLVPTTLDNFPFLLVDSEETMMQCIKEIEESKPDALAFDLEMYNPSAHTCVTCLLQLSTKSKSYVIDVLVPEVWQMVSLLAPIFADRNVVKIGQSIGTLDVPSLHRDFGIFVVNAFDTYEAAWLLRLPKLGLSGLCEYYGLPSAISKEYHRLKKTYQMTDWRKRPLSPDMLRYGRSDVHYLIALRTLLIRDLTRGDLWEGTGDKRTEASSAAEALLVSKALKAMLKRSDSEHGSFLEDGDDTKSVATSQGSTVSAEDGYFTPEEDSFEVLAQSDEDVPSNIIGPKDLRMNANLMKVLTESQQRCLSFWKHRKERIQIRHESFFSAAIGGALGDEGGVASHKESWSKHHSRLCEQLVEWRRDIARAEGTLPGLVCSTEFLVAIVRMRPASHSDLRRVSYFLPELLRDEQCSYVRQLFDLVRSFGLGENGSVDGSMKVMSAHTISTSVRETTIRRSEMGALTTITSEMVEENLSTVAAPSSAAEQDIDASSLQPEDENEKYDKVEPKDTEEKSYAKTVEGDPGISRFFVNVVVVIAIGATIAVLLTKRRRR